MRQQGRDWPVQLVESAIYLVLTLLLLGVGHTRAETRHLISRGRV